MSDLKNPHHLQLLVKVFTLHNLQERFQLLLQPLGLLGGQNQSQPHVGSLDLHALLQLPDHLQSLRSMGTHPFVKVKDRDRHSQ